MSIFTTSSSCGPWDNEEITLEGLAKQFSPVPFLKKLGALAHALEYPERYRIIFPTPQLRTEFFDAAEKLPCFAPGLEEARSRSLVLPSADGDTIFVLDCEALRWWMPSGRPK